MKRSEDAEVVLRPKIPSPNQKSELSLGGRPKSLAEKVYEAIRQAIIAGTIEPGERVTENSLAERLSVSKTPVREALLELRRVGLIVDWGRRGGQVITPSREAFQEVSETREAIEVLVSANAARRASEAEKRAIVQAAKNSLKVAKSGDISGFHEANVIFHTLIADCARNSRMSSMLRDLFDLGSLLRLRDLPPIHDLVKYGEDHVAIAQRIAEGDAEGAAEAAREHVVHTRRENLEAFDRRNAASAE
ncbi:GntR family transcriptional regulator [Pelagibius sp. CAU 1746]|uniref:GntR family transcriptional regulator n=1 Tax=Pelagibius sp. CAU 1746 TaxID=3140370 RepID=UPI00325B5B42